MSAERIGGGLGADGLGELSKLLLGRDPLLGLRVARDVEALAIVIPAFASAIGYDVGSERQPAPLDEHLFAVVEGLAGCGDVALLLAALLHDLGKPEADRTGAGHAELGARIARDTLGHLRYPTRLRQEVVHLVRAHAFRTEAAWDGPSVRRFLAEHGDAQARRLVELKRADLGAKRVGAAETAGLAVLAAGIEREQGSPHRLADLAVDGADLIAIGLREGPALGVTLRRLLDAVIDDPTLNERERLLRLAEEAAA